MRDYQIKLEPFTFIALKDLKIIQEVNHHAEAELVVRIKDELQEEYMSTLMNETWVKITAIDKENEDAAYTILFHGIVTDFSFDRDGYETILNLKLKSGSILMDLKPHFRVFQNENASCLSIHQQITGTYQGGQVVCTAGSEEKTGGTLIQYQETDWEFVRRLAGRSGICLVPDVQKKGSGYTIGIPKGTKRVVDNNGIRMRLDVREYMEKQQNGKPELQPSDMMELVLDSREIFQMGDVISHQGKDYLVCGIRTTYQEAECSHEYTLRTEEALWVLPEERMDLAGSSFDAVITDVKKDKVQVMIPGDEWKAADGKKWFLYSTVYSSPDGTGWYCMPEIGDSVRLYVPEKEEGSFIISAVHRETDAARQKPDYKSLKTKYGKEILFTPDTILMTNNQGMMVEMNDSEGITITSDKDVVIQADDNLTIASNSASLLIAAKDKVQVKQGGTTMTLSGDISFTGGEFRIQ